MEDYERNDPNPVDLEELDKLKGMGVKEMLEEARKQLVMQLLLKVKAGDASASELAVLRNLLRDNGMILGFTDTPSGETEAEQGGGLVSPVGFQLPDLEDDDESAGPYFRVNQQE